ncbi:hypothetical protein [Streptomyces sp. NPDC127100]|uniref:hypothetical protein n=1 Tax=Streptomyces sp. NPDC127100 TaxID=3347138 RepID=UPI003660103B
MTTGPSTYPAEHAAYLTEVRDRTAAATEGDWHVHDETTMAEIVSGAEPGHGTQRRRVIARLHADPDDNIPEHADWDEGRDYEQVLADAAFAAKARTDVPHLLALVAEQHQALTAAREELRAVREVLAPAGQPRRVPTDPDAPLAETVGWLADRAETLAARLEKVREFRIPLKNTLGGYAELTIERGPGPYDDRWGVTDGAMVGKRAWYGNAWHSISDLGVALAYAWSMDAALSLAEEAAGIEGARLDREVRAIQGEQAGTAGRPAGGAQ